MICNRFNGQAVLAARKIYIMSIEAQDNIPLEIYSRIPRVAINILSKIIVVGLTLFAYFKLLNLSSQCLPIRRHPVFSHARCRSEYNSPPRTGRCDLSRDRPPLQGYRGAAPLPNTVPR